MYFLYSLEFFIEMSRDPLLKIILWGRENSPPPISFILLLTGLIKLTWDRWTGLNTQIYYVYMYSGSIKIRELRTDQAIGMMCHLKLKRMGVVIWTSKEGSWRELKSIDFHWWSLHIVRHYLWALYEIHRGPLFIY